MQSPLRKVLAIDLILLVFDRHTELGFLYSIPLPENWDFSILFRFLNYISENGIILYDPFRRIYLNSWFYAKEIDLA